LENHFLSNCETHALHIDATFRSFVHGDLNVNDYYQKMKGFVDSLADLDVNVTDCVLVLNVLHRLNKNFEHLYAIFTHATPFPLFQKVPEGNPVGNSGSANCSLDPHRPLCRAEAYVILYLPQWAGMPARIAAATITSSTTTSAVVQQEEEQPQQLRRRWRQWR
jgi:hypothetical protein